MWFVGTLIIRKRHPKGLVHETTVTKGSQTMAKKLNHLLSFSDDDLQIFVKQYKASAAAKEMVETVPSLRSVDERYIAKTVYGALTSVLHKESTSTVQLIWTKYTSSVLTWTTHSLVCWYAQIYFKCCSCRPQFLQNINHRSTRV